MLCFLLDSELIVFSEAQHDKILKRTDSALSQLINLMHQIVEE